MGFYFCLKVRTLASEHVQRSFGEVLPWAPDGIASLNHRGIRTGACLLKTRQNGFWFVDRCICVIYAYVIVAQKYPVIFGVRKRNFEGGR